MRLAWFPINPERIPDEERKIARTALGIFTDLAIPTREDLRPENILIQYHSDGPKMIPHSQKESRVQRDAKMERRLLRKILRYPCAQNPVL